MLFTTNADKESNSTTIHKSKFRDTPNCIESKFPSCVWILRASRRSFWRFKPKPARWFIRGFVFEERAWIVIKISCSTSADCLRRECNKTRRRSSATCWIFAKEVQGFSCTFSEPVHSQFAILWNVIFSNWIRESGHWLRIRECTTKRSLRKYAI